MMVIRPVEAEVVDRVIKHMRLFDPSVLEQVSDPELTMRALAKKSYAMWAGFIEDEPICAAGVYTPSLLDGNAMIWVITTPEIEEHQFTFVRQCHIFIHELAKNYNSISGFVDVRFERSIKWLKWMGFTVSNSAVLKNNRLYHPFCLKGEQWQTHQSSQQ